MRGIRVLIVTGSKYRLNKVIRTTTTRYVERVAEVHKTLNLLASAHIRYVNAGHVPSSCMGGMHPNIRTTSHAAETVTGNRHKSREEVKKSMVTIRRVHLEHVVTDVIRVRLMEYGIRTLDSRK